MKNDQEIVLAAVQQYALALRNASNEMKNDPVVVLAAVERDGWALYYASDEMKNGQDRILVERVSQGVSSPAFIPGAYNKTHETGVIEFVQWYSDLLIEKLSDTLTSKL